MASNLNIHQWINSRIEGQKWLAACSLGIIFGLIEGFIHWIKMILGVPDPMGPEILWVTPLFYALLWTLIGLVLFSAIQISIRLLRLPQRIAELLQHLGVGVLILLGFLNSIELMISTGLWAEIILAAGLTYQSILLLSKRKGGTIVFLASKITWLIGVVVLILIIVDGNKYIQERLFLAGLPQAKTNSPNVLLITLDTLRADHLSTYGYKRTTPNLDKFASEGLKFDYAIANSPWTLPSHATIMTGLYTHEHKAEIMTGGKLNGKFFTLAEAFSENGYQTAAFVANEYSITANQGFAKGFSYYNNLFWSVEDAVRLTNIGEKIRFKILLSPQLKWYDMGRKSADDVNNEFISWLSGRTDRPFFVWLNYFDVHDPYRSYPPFDTEYGTKPALGDPGSFGAIGASDWGGELSPEETQWKLDAYDSAIAYLDDRVGRLFKELQKDNLYNNTIIVVTSDHGEAFGEHGLYGHANSLYRELLHVPLFLRYPEQIPIPREITQTVELRDLPITITSMAGLQLHQQFPGQRLDLDIQQEPVLSELYKNPYQPASHAVAHENIFSITTDNWHAIFLNDKVELYSHDDHYEQLNLADTTSGNEIITKLKGELSSYLQK
jgi:arylsulfatase A-like enzyme